VNDWDADRLMEVLTAIDRSLQRIASAIELMVAPEQTEPEAAPPEGCQHPNEKRVDLGDEWECTVCRTRFPDTLVSR